MPPRRPATQNSLPSIKQQWLCQQFIAYIKIILARDLTNEEIHNYTRGLCVDLSITFSFMAAIQKNNWWVAGLKEVAVWDRQKASLEKILQLPDETPSRDLREKTLGFLFERAISYVDFGGCDEKYQDIKHGKGHSFLKEGGDFDSEMGKIVASTTVAGYFTDERLNAVFREAFFNHKAIHIITGEFYRKTAELNQFSKSQWARHTCAVRFDGTQWCLYNPDSGDDEKKFNNKYAFLYHLKQHLGRNLAITIASWRQDFEPVCQAFFTAFQNHVKADILNELGIHVIVAFTSSRLPSLVDKISRGESTAICFLANALTTLDDDCESGFCILAHDAPHLLLYIFDIALKHESVAREISSALILKTSDGFSGVDLFCKISPSISIPVFDHFLTLAEKNEYIFEDFVYALSFFNEVNKKSSFQMIIQCYSSRLSSLIKLINKKEDELSRLCRCLAGDPQLDLSVLHNLITTLEKTSCANAGVLAPFLRELEARKESFPEEEGRERFDFHALQLRLLIMIEQHVDAKIRSLASTPLFPKESTQIQSTATTLRTAIVACFTLQEIRCCISTAGVDQPLAEALMQKIPQPSSHSVSPAASNSGLPPTPKREPGK